MTLHLNYPVSELEALSDIAEVACQQQAIFSVRCPMSDAIFRFQSRRAKAELLQSVGGVFNMPLSVPVTKWAPAPGSENVWVAAQNAHQAASEDCNPVACLTSGRSNKKLVNRQPACDVIFPDLRVFISRKILTIAKLKPVWQHTTLSGTLCPDFS